MSLYLKYFRWVMLVSGLLTCTMFLGLFAPETSLLSNFGETIYGSVAQVVVRNWSALIGLVGLTLIYGSFVRSVRRFALVLAGVSKVIFILLVLIYAPGALSFGAGTAVVADTLMVILYAVYLAASMRQSET